MTYRFLLFILLVALNGCAALTERVTQPTPLIKAPASPGEAVLIARDLVDRGRWAAALDILDAAVEQSPEDTALQVERDSLVSRWTYQEQRMEDQITIADAENQRHKIAILERLSRAEPDNLLLTSRRIYWKEVLKAKAEALTRCSESYVNADPVLAKRCYSAASDIAADKPLQDRLALVLSQLKEGEQLAAERQRVNAAKERQLRAKVLLGEARVAIEAHDYRRALDILQRVTKLQPGNQEVEGLQQEAWSMISPQIEALVKLGDHLYLDEQIAAAVATWQAALNLQPDHEDILARIERATTVLDRLDELREQQHPALPASAQ